MNTMKHSAIADLRFKSRDLDSTATGRRGKQALRLFLCYYISPASKAYFSFSFLKGGGWGRGASEGARLTHPSVSVYFVL